MGGKGNAMVRVGLTEKKNSTRAEEKKRRGINGHQCRSSSFFRIEVFSLTGAEKVGKVSFEEKRSGDRVQAGKEAAALCSVARGEFIEKGDPFEKKKKKKQKKKKEKNTGKTPAS